MDRMEFLGTYRQAAWACQVLVAFMAVGFPLAARATNQPAKIPPKLVPIPGCPDVVTAARRHAVALEEFGVPSPTNGLRAGDAASVLITFIEKKKQTQWLLEVEALASDPKKSEPKTNQFTVRSSFGPPMKFESKPAPVGLRMLGPFGAAGWKNPPRWEMTKAEVSLNEGFLGLGMEEAAAAVFRWSRTVDFSKGVSSNALSAVNPTPAEQRAVCATFPALMSYFEIVQHTEGLKGLLYQLVDMPSVWSMLKHRGIHVDFSFGNGLAPSIADPLDWNLAASSRVYYFPWLVRLNGQPALKITLVTTSARSPLLICGGLVGVLLEKLGDDKTYMTLRLVSAGFKGEATEKSR